MKQFWQDDDMGDGMPFIAMQVFIAEKVGESIPDHRHKVDHNGAIMHGKALIKLADGKLHEFESRPGEPPKWFKIKAGLDHQIIFMEVGTTMICFERSENLGMVYDYAALRGKS